MARISLLNASLIAAAARANGTVTTAPRNRAKYKRLEPCFVSKMVAGISAERFPKPQVTETAWEAPMIFQSSGLSVEAAFVDHTVPCLAFAVVAEPRISLDEARLAKNPVPKGRWVNEVINLLQTSAPLEPPVTLPSDSPPRCHAMP